MIYFDSAATTLQKPKTVHQAVLYAMEHMASPGRGGHKASMLAAETVFSCRMALANYFEVAKASHVVFTQNATHGLNIAIKTLAQKGDHVVVSGYEHNSVMRPLFHLGAKVSVARAALFSPKQQIEAFRRAITKETKLVVCNHVSNVFGYILPIEEIAALCKERGVAFIIDASQSAGVLPLSMEKLGANFIAMPGHKSLYGPQGTGVLLCKNPPRKSILEGGTGSDSLSLHMPTHLPDSQEAGTINVAGIAGLLAGLGFVRENDELLEKERALLTKLISQLKTIAGITLFVAEDTRLQTAVLSFQKKGMDAEDLAEYLGEEGFCLRAGLHCSPQAHKSGNTLREGTVRLSFSAFNTENEVEKFCHFLKKGRK